MAYIQCNSKEKINKVCDKGNVEIYIFITIFDKLFNKILILYLRGIYMKKNNGNIISILLIFLGIISMVTSVHAHSGKTDSNGGHRDNKNKSGLGSYHYHCGGHPAHLHTDGVCPYSSGLKLNKSGMSSSSSSNTNTKSTVPTAIEVLDIKINENVTSMKE